MVSDESRNATAEAQRVVAGEPQHQTDRPASKPRENRQRENNVGQALRSVYQQTVNENVPDEMLALLGKLI